MKKALTLILTACILILALGLVACKKPCEHTYDNACDTKCNECEEEREITHSFKDATCTEARTCTVCGATDGESNGHTPSADDGDCTTAVSCSVCQKVVIEAKKEHTQAQDDGSCITAVACANCETILVEARAEHEQSEDDMDCTTPLTCKHCDYIYVQGIEHVFNTLFNATYSDHFHTCTNDGCRAETTKENHVAPEVIEDCTQKVACTACGWTIAEAKAEHEASEDDGNCTTAVSCKHCKQIVIEATQEHAWTYEKIDNEVHKRLSCKNCLYEANATEEHTPNSDGDCPCGESYEAKVGIKYYKTLSEALVNWVDGTTLTLVTNISYEQSAIDIDGKSVALNLNGYELAMENQINIGKNEKGALSISDSREGGSINVNATYSIMVYNGNFELMSGRLNQTIDIFENAVCDIKGGEICGRSEASLTYAIYASGVVNISGGRLAGRFGIWATTDSEINISGTPTIIGKDQNTSNKGASIFLINSKATISGSPILQGDSLGEIMISRGQNQIILETQPEENSTWRVRFDGSTLEQAKVLTPAQGIELDITRFESISAGYVLEKQSDGCIYFVACTHENAQTAINENNTHNISCEKCNINIENEAHTNQDGKCICGYEYVTITGEDKSYEYVDGGVKLDVASLFEISNENYEVKYTLEIPTDSDGEGTLEGTSATLELVGTYVIVAKIEATKNNASATKQITIEVTSPAGSGSFDGEWVGF